MSGVAILAALQREHASSGSYSAVRRILANIRKRAPPQTSCRLDFVPGEAAQVDFGTAPMLMPPRETSSAAPGLVTVRSASGLNEESMLSNLEAAKSFNQTMQALKGALTAER